jgi:hypothetical protein
MNYLNFSAAQLFLLTLLGASSIASAQDWRMSAEGTAYAYFNTLQVRNDSVLNPNNLVAKLAERSTIAEGRFNLKAESTSLRFSARPILMAQQDYLGTESKDQSQAYLSQWQARWKASDSVALSGGRELLNWGAAQFRSPSSPFYFNNGRSNPMTELSGMDAVRLAWSPSVNTSVYAARLFGSGQNHAEPDPWRTGWLLKADWRGDETAVGLAVSKSAQQAAFLGAHAQSMFGDEWLLYGELGSSTLNNTLLSPADVNQPFTLTSESARKTNYLLGVAYTFEGGQTLSTEYLHYGHGYTSTEIGTYFARAASASSNLPSAMPILAMALSAPPLLGRDYLHLVWQSNLLANTGFSRFMLTRNLSDNSSELSAYTEHTLNPHVTIFAFASLSDGGVQRELSRFYGQLLGAGLKVPLP